MQGASRLFWVLAVFLFLATAVYAVWSWLYDMQGLATDPSGAERSAGIEWVGTAAMTLCGVLATLIAFYLGRVHRQIGQRLPEDREDAEIDDGNAEQGFFSPWSWWPICLAGSAALVFLGVAAGFWIAFIGAFFGLVSLIGLVFEYYRGNFSR